MAKGVAARRTRHVQLQGEGAPCAGVDMHTWGVGAPRRSARIRKRGSHSEKRRLSHHVSGPRLRHRRPHEVQVGRQESLRT